MANNVRIDLELAIADALKNLEVFSGKMTNSLSGLEKAAQGFNSKLDFVGLSTGFLAVSKAGEILSDAFGTVANVIERVVEEASQQQVAVNDLQNAFRLAGVPIDDATTSLENFAKQIQATSVYQDDQVLSAAALIETFTKLDKEGLQKATQSAIELAAATGQDLASASEVVSKAINGNSTALKKLFPGFKEGATQGENLARVFELISSQLGGSAQSKLGTYSGAVAQATNSYEGLLSTVGQAITNNTTLISVINRVGEVFANLDTIVSKNGDSLSKFITDGILFLIDSLKYAVKWVATLDTFLSAFYNTLAPIVRFLGSIPELSKGLLDAINGNTATLKTLNSQLNEAAEQDQKNTKDRVNLYSKLQGTLETLKTTGSKANTEVKKLAGSTSSVLAVTKDIRSEIDSDFKALSDSLKNVGLSQIQIINQEKDERLKTLDEALKAQKVNAQEAASFREKIEIDASEKIWKINKEIQDKEAEALKKLEEDRKKIILETLQAIQGVTSSIVSTASSFQSVDAAKEDAKSRIEAINSAHEAALAALEQEKIAGTISAEELASKKADIELQYAKDLADQKQKNEESIAAARKAADKKAVDTTANLVGSAAGAAANMFLPGSGAIVSEIVETLAKGPEGIQQAIDGITDAIPMVIENIAASLDEILISLLKNMPDIIKGLFKGVTAAFGEILKNLPEIVFALIQSLFEQLADIGEFIWEILKFALDAFVKVFLEIPGQFLKTLVNGLIGALNFLFGWIPGFHIPELSKGGLITGGTPGKDSVPTMLMPGELVIPRDDVTKLRSFLDSPQSFDSGAIQQTKTQKLSNEKQTSQNLTINLKIGESELAKILLDLNRKGFRTA